MKATTKKRTSGPSRDNIDLETETNGARSKSQKKVVRITAPNFTTARFHITGLTRLVICRFSLKAREAIIAAQVAGAAGKSKKKITKSDPEVQYAAARYYSPEGWEGFNAAAVRNGMISACRVADIRMTLAKLCVFAVADGYDKYEPQFPLIRIYGKPTMQQDHVRNRNTGQYTVATRACYHNWKAILGLQWDSDKFTDEDITNLLMRCGLQVGFGVGRHDSKDSNGMGWGTFEIDKSK